MYKIVTVIGTRPEIIKLSKVINELDKYTNQVLVHTGQNYDYELNEIFFKDLGIRKPNYFLNIDNKNPIEAISQTLVRVDNVLEKEKPDAFLVYGDTNSCLCAICAKKRKIPIFHMEAGNRCFDERVPEEINRRIIDHISDINLTLSEHARNYLIREGIRPERIMKVGSSMKEVLNSHKESINKSNILEELDLKENEYFIVSIHREENLDINNNFIKIIETLNYLSDNYNKKIVFSLHPRTRKKIESNKELYKLNENILLMKPLGFIDYIKLQQKSFCTISDSGTITEESSILCFPAITIRETIERPEGMDVGTLIMSGIDKEYVANSVEVVTNQYRYNPNCIKQVKDYEVENVSSKVIRIIFSYIGYVNREVWKK